MAKKNFFRAPEHNRWFNAALARARRHIWYRQLLWQRLRAVGPTKARRRTDGAEYLDLLKRALRHEKLMERETAKVLHWVMSTDHRRAKPILQLLRGGKES